MAEGAEKRSGRAWPVLKEYAKAGSKYPWLLFWVIVSSISVDILSVIAPLYIKDFIDTIAGSQASDVVVGVLVSILAAYGGVLLARWVAARIQYIALEWLSAKVGVDLYNRAYTYLIGHSHRFFTSNFSGALQRKVGRYSLSFDSVFDTFISNFLSTAIFAAGSIFILSQRSVYLGLGIVVWVIVFIYIQTLLAKLRQPLRVERAKSETKLSGALSDSITNQPTVSQFAAEAHERKILGDALKDWYRATMRTNRADIIIWGAQGLLAIVVEVGLFYAAILLWQQGLISVGDFVLMQVYILALISRIWGIGDSMRRLYSAFADAHEMIEIFETPYEVKDAPDAKTLVVEKGKIELRNVSFEFNDERPLLKNFSLTVLGGQKVALVGPSGAGKSTVTKLILRMHDITNGDLRIDEQDVRSVTQESLRKSISFVPQEPILFHRSLADNIRYGKPDATDEEVIEAAKKAHCHEFIDSLPEKYETHVGERGVKLSGGERQRVAIARAILKNAPILILDEATSALDSESEALIQDALKVLMEGKTVIVIAHRLSTIMTMDRIVVIEAGKVVADGTHDELVLQQGGLYQKLWSIQAGGFIKD